MISSRPFNRRNAAVLCMGLACLPSLANGFELAFPGTAELITSTSVADGRHPIALGPWSEAGLPSHDALGVVQQFTWQVSGADITTVALLSSLRDQIETQGFETQFTCFARACGGFDFRHSLPVGSAPEMHVDLGDFHYLSATSDDGASEVALMISRGGSVGFVHLALIQPPSEAEDPVVQSSRGPDVAISDVAPDALIARLSSVGSAPLDDLQFETGASQLSGDDYASLAALAVYLAENPALHVVLVGHTDAAGSLSGNIALSRARALAVRTYLTEDLGVNPAQVEAQGIGYLAPRATNATPDGREANRRVEVVIADPQ
ncbi:OmpA family protein [Rhodobacteraceae bacterium M385]|nr:OmpA family protein [Rhodobacteraceae bacterium M385]